MNKYTGRYFSEEIREKVEQSTKENEAMRKRTVRCPFCMVPLFYACTDTAGHFTVKCTRCRQISCIDLGRFYTSKTPKPFPGIDMLPPFAD